MENKKHIPITRVNKFFSQDDFELEQDFGREWLEGDLNMKVILYRVDAGKTQSDSVYGEAGRDEIRFKPPVELYVYLTITEPKNKSYNPNGSLRYVEHGNMSFGIYQQQLDELGVDITYGDYIAYQESETRIKYYTVSSNGGVYTDNKHTILGYKGFYRTVECVPTTEDEFRGR